MGKYKLIKIPSDTCFYFCLNYNQYDVELYMCMMEQGYIQDFIDEQCVIHTKLANTLLLELIRLRKEI